MTYVKGDAMRVRRIRDLTHGVLRLTEAQIRRLVEELRDNDTLTDRELMELIKLMKKRRRIQL